MNHGLLNMENTLWPFEINPKKKPLVPLADDSAGCNRGLTHLASSRYCAEFSTLETESYALEMQGSSFQCLLTPDTGICHLLEAEMQEFGHPSLLRACSGFYDFKY